MLDYATMLKSFDLKATFQRVLMLENIQKQGHISIDALYETLLKTHASLSLATVYKNIILMEEKGLLTEVAIAGKKSKYELHKKEHIHLICTTCGDIEDKKLQSDSDTLFATLSKEENFSLHTQQINLYGVCRVCQ